MGAKKIKDRNICNPDGLFSTEGGLCFINFFPPGRWSEIGEDKKIS